MAIKDSMFHYKGVPRDDEEDSLTDFPSRGCAGSSLVGCNLNAHAILTFVLAVSLAIVSYMLFSSSNTTEGVVQTVPIPQYNDTQEKQTLSSDVQWAPFPSQKKSSIQSSLEAA